MNLWRWKTRKRLISILACAFIGSYLVLTSIVLTTGHGGVLVDSFEDNEGEKRPEMTQVTQYNLPSLDQILNSVTDLDFRKVVSNYRKEHEEIPEGTPNVNLVISSTWRSGSTLLGEILASYPGVYYHYEPLMSYGMGPIDSKSMPEVEKLLKDLLSCSYNHTEENYLRFAYSNPDIFRRNERLWKICSGMPRFKCYIWDILDKLCSLFPIHLMKIVRARLSLISALLTIPNTKIIWLVRDPRGIISSRLHSVDWCTTKSCKDPSILCEDLSQDYQTYKTLKSRYPDKIMALRYEDLARNPKDKSREVLEFIGLSYHSNVEEYLSTHLTEDVESPWSTIHDSQKRMGRWMRVSPWEEVVKTQYSCRQEMELLGYRLFTSQSDYSSGNSVKRMVIDKL